MQEIKHDATHAIIEFVPSEESKYAYAVIRVCSDRAYIKCRAGQGRVRGRERGRGCVPGRDLYRRPAVQEIQKQAIRASIEYAKKLVWGNIRILRNVSHVCSFSLYLRAYEAIRCAQRRSRIEM